MRKPRLDEDRGAAMEQSKCNKVYTFPDRAASREVRRNFVCTRSRQLDFRLYCFIAYRTPSPCVVQNANTHQCIANASCLRAPPRCERKSRWRKRECCAGQKKWKNKHNQHDVQRQRQLKQQHDNQKTALCMTNKKEEQTHSMTCSGSSS